MIGQSADDRNLYEVVLGNPQAKKHLVVIANLHAREYMTTQLCMRQIEYYLNYYNKKINGTKVSKVLDKVAIHYVPSCNPDGTAISQFGTSAIRDKDLREALRRMSGSSTTWKANARGVDLNRNWDVAFRKGGTRGSSGFRGNRAASEPEIKALVKMINRIEKKGKIMGVVSYHSTGSILYGRCAGNITAKVEQATTRTVPDRTESDRLSSDADAEHKLRSRMFPGVFPLQEKDPVYHTGSRTGRLPAVKQRVPVNLEKK